LEAVFQPAAFTTVACGIFHVAYRMLYKVCPMWNISFIPILMLLGIKGGCGLYFGSTRFRRYLSYSHPRICGALFLIFSLSFGVGAIGVTSSFAAGSQLQLPAGSSFFAEYGQSIWAVQSQTNHVTILSSASGQTQTSIQVGADPVAVSFDSSHAWVANRNSNSVSEINTSTLRVIQNIRVGLSPDNLVSDGADVWVANSSSNNVSEISVLTGRVVNTIAVGQNPSSITEQAGDIWVANYASNNVSVIAINSAKVIATIAVGAGPTSISSDSLWVWTANYSSNSISQISVPGIQLVQTVALQIQPTSISSSSGQVWVSGGSSNTVVYWDAVGSESPLYLTLSGPSSEIDSQGQSALNLVTQTGVLTEVIGPSVPNTPVIQNIPNYGIFGSAWTPNIRTNSDGLISVTSLTPTVCSSSDPSGNVQFLGVGMCSLQAESAASQYYFAGSGVVQNFPIAPKAPSFNLGDVPRTGIVGEILNVEVVDQDNISAQPQSLTPNICSVGGPTSTLTLLSKGNCLIVFFAPASGDYASGNSAPWVIEVDKAPQQALNFAPGPLNQSVGVPVLLSTIGGSSGLPVIFTTKSSGCSIALETLTSTQAGTCVVVATEPGGANYLDASATQDFIFTPPAPAAPVISNSIRSGLVKSLIGLQEAGAPAKDVSWSVTGTGCSIAGRHHTAVSDLRIGSCVVTATDTVTGLSSDPATFTFTGIAQAPVTVYVNSPLALNQPIDLVAFGGSGGGAFSFALVPGSVNSASCSLSGAKLIATTAGECAVEATRGAHARYAPVVSAPLTLQFSPTA